MRLEWDSEKAASNEAKHGISFDVATLVFDDPNYVAFVDAVIDGEERWHAIGLVEDFGILTVVHTYRDENNEEVVRIISARPAIRNERKFYAENY